MERRKHYIDLTNLVFTLIIVIFTVASVVIAYLEYTERDSRDTSKAPVVSPPVASNETDRQLVEKRDSSGNTTGSGTPTDPEAVVTPSPGTPTSRVVQPARPDVEPDVSSQPPQPPLSQKSEPEPIRPELQAVNGFWSIQMKSFEFRGCLDDGLASVNERFTAKTGRKTGSLSLRTGHGVRRGLIYVLRISEETATSDIYTEIGVLELGEVVPERQITARANPDLVGRASHEVVFTRNGLC